MRSLLYKQQYDQEGRLSGGSLHMRLQRSNQLFPVLAASSLYMQQRGQGGRGDRRWLPGALASGQALAAARPGREGRAQAASRFGNARESVGEMREGSLWPRMQTQWKG